MLLFKLLCMVAMAAAMPAPWPSRLKRSVTEPTELLASDRAVRSPEDTEELHHEENADAHAPPADPPVDSPADPPVDSPADPPAPQLKQQSSSGNSNSFIGWIPINLQPFLSGLQSVPSTIQSQISSIPGNIQSSISSIPGLSSLQSSLPSLPGLPSLPSLSGIQSQLPFSLPSLPSVPFLSSWLGGGSSGKYLVPMTRSPYYVYAAYPM